mgnify:CR=1 FL=1
MISTHRRLRLALAVHALVENAVRHGGAAEVTVERSGERWIIAIADLGPGIPPAEFEAILQPFHRLDVARQRNTKGFGLGIPTAHHLMMRFDGALTRASCGHYAGLHRRKDPR